MSDANSIADQEYKYLLKTTRKYKQSGQNDYLFMAISVYFQPLVT
jgi:hypothetical protein